MHCKVFQLCMTEMKERRKKMNINKFSPLIFSTLRRITLFFSHSYLRTTTALYFLTICPVKYFRQISKFSLDLPYLPLALGLLLITRSLLLVVNMSECLVSCSDSLRIVDLCQQKRREAHQSHKSTFKHIKQS